MHGFLSAVVRYQQLPFLTTPVLSRQAMMDVPRHLLTAKSSSANKPSGATEPSGRNGVTAPSELDKISLTNNKIQTCLGFYARVIIIFYYLLLAHV